MKDLTTLLSKGNLTPKERVLLLVANQVSEERDGKQILTDADKHALMQGWTPKDNSEAREYNRYNEGWNTAMSASLDMQTIYLSAEVALLRANRLVDYASFMDIKRLIEQSKKMFGDLEVDDDDARDLILKNSGLEFEYVVYRYAFESLGEELKQDMLALCPDAQTESQYFDQEEVIANAFNGKNTLTKEAKEKLADTMVDSPYQEYAKWWQLTDEMRASMNTRWIGGYYASIPNLDIVKKWADYTGIYTQKECDDLKKKDDEIVQAELTQKITEYAEKQGTDTQALLKQIIIRWIDDGLLVKDGYTPIWNSKDKNTCNDTDTKLPHKEVFRAWLKAKDEARAILQNLIDTDKLHIQDMHREIFGVKKTLHILTGESLYILEGDFVFAQDFKKQVDDFIGIGKLIMFLQQHEFLKDYATLLGFAEIFKRLSKTYEIDLTYKIQYRIRSFQEDIKNVNRALRFIAENLEFAIYLKHDVVFFKETFIGGMLIDLEKIEPGMGETETHYLNEFKKILGDDF